MFMLKKLFNLGLAASIDSVINGKGKKLYPFGHDCPPQIHRYMGGDNKTIVHSRVDIEFVSDFKTKEKIITGYYVKSYAFDREYGNYFELWKSHKFLSFDEANGCLTKEVRIAQKKFPWIIFYRDVAIKQEVMNDYDEIGERIIYDEFVNNKWVRSTKIWMWDPVFTMRDEIFD